MIMASRMNVGCACLVLILSFSGVLEVRGSFCSRASANKGCPVPPTVDTIDISKYVGTWYEIGTSAAFKLLQESGRICDQALYGLAQAATQDRGANITVLNSATRVIDSQASLGVTGISLSSQSVCSNARKICYTFDRDGKASLALTQINSEAQSLAYHKQEEASQLISYAQDIQSSVDQIQSKLDALSSTVAKIQGVDGQLSQKVGNTKSNLDAIKQLVNEAKGYAGAVEDLAKQMESKAGDVLVVSGKLSAAEEYGSSAKVAEASSWISAESELILAYLEQIQASLDGVLASEKLINPDKTVQESYSDIKGYAIQDKKSAGKLMVTFTNISVTAPYWIIALEGSSSAGYEAALVYSCSEIAGVKSQSFFVLSRKPYISAAIFHKFMATSASYGILLECDDPFIYTVQRGGNCGAPRV